MKKVYTDFSTQKMRTFLFQQNVIVFLHKKMSYIWGGFGQIFLPQVG